jgi:hypothetical protein
MQYGSSIANLILILRLLVLQKQLQALFADHGLKVAAPSMALFRLITVEITLIPLLVGLTDHLTFAMVPNDGHPGLQIPNMSDLIGEVGVRLTAHIKDIGDRNKKVSLNADGAREHPRTPQKCHIQYEERSSGKLGSYRSTASQ